ncbi:MAG: DUF433 domain-containing protein [Phycisphaerae bacterium]|nr:DUF433 domain-containing protein [Phycisphaerae bacterium]
MSVVTTHPEIMHGTPCFAGTRVPASIVFDYLTGGYSIDEFFEQYPSVKREQVVALLEQCRIYADASAEKRSD